ncbi:hypothetical protein DE146DRAFT_125707 [Phaeosphaeria sp. MPI-PUGE-AT-0046c]|nr:hypothetical protein DE146DRAFT_125707 [Phaeosphaeria sp. MPI-PUGE-AT-0046c]
MDEEMPLRDAARLCYAIYRLVEMRGCDLFGMHLTAAQRNALHVLDGEAIQNRPIRQGTGECVRSGNGVEILALISACFPPASSYSARLPNSTTKTMSSISLPAPSSCLALRVQRTIISSFNRRVFAVSCPWIKLIPSASGSLNSIGVSLGTEAPAEHLESIFHEDSDLKSKPEPELDSVHLCWLGVVMVVGQHKSAAKPAPRDP